MKSVLAEKTFSVLLVFFTFTSFIFAALPEIPTLTGRVVDNANMISPAGRAKISAAIQRLEGTTGGQMAVLTMPSLNGDALEDFSMRVAETWKIGRKGQDNGIILLLVKDSRQIRLEVGYGWEGIINDARAGDIIREMVVFFKNNQIDDGICFSVLKITNIISGKPVDGLSDKKTKKKTAPLSTGLIVIIVIIGLVISFFRRNYYGNSYHHGGGGGGGFSGGGGFGGGGGGFGGGGASGRW